MIVIAVVIDIVIVIKEVSRSDLPDEGEAPQADLPDKGEAPQDELPDKRGAPQADLPDGVLAKEYSSDFYCGALVYENIVRVNKVLDTRC